jgi:hypothetical protein
MILITCEVIALIISLRQNDHNDIFQSVFYLDHRSNYNMTLLRTYLFTATLFIFAASIYVVMAMGINWPAVYVGDILSLNWRSHINVDFLLHLCLLASWVSWREGFTVHGFLLGFLCIFLGATFGFPYLLLATYEAKGDPEALLLGVHTGKLSK